MDAEVVLRLQREIDDATRKCRPKGVKRIELGPGSEVTNLSRNADVRVHTLAGAMRGFSIVDMKLMERMFSPEVQETLQAESPRPDMADIYATGGPLIVVREINGDSIVRAVIRYLEMEASREGY